MIRRQIREWSKLAIGTGPDDIPRRAANQLIRVARSAHKALALGGPPGLGVIQETPTYLRAGQVVGVMTCPAASLEILPKIDSLESGSTRRNLVQMLAIALNIKIADGELDSLGVQARDLLELIITLFSKKLFTAVHRGMPRRYVESSADLRALRGRLNVIRQFTALAASPQFVACRYDDLSENIAINQILKLAILRLRSASRLLDNQRRLRELRDAFVDVDTVADARQLFGSLILDRTNVEFHSLVRMAELLLGRQFQNTSFGQNEGFSLLFEMNTLFERYVGSVLKRSFVGSDLFVTLQGPRVFALSHVPSGQLIFQTKPDMVVHRSGPRLIIDTKWKRISSNLEDRKHGVPEQDVYQMMAYGRVHNVNQLMLLYPHHSELPNVGVQARYDIAGSNDSQLTIATVDLSDLRSVPEQLRRLVRGVSTTSDLKGGTADLPNVS